MDTRTREANSTEGNIWKTRHFTWTEMAMLRMLTQGAEAVRKLPLHGNPRLPTNVRDVGGEAVNNVRLFVGCLEHLECNQ